MPTIEASSRAHRAHAPVDQQPEKAQQGDEQPDPSLSANPGLGLLALQIRASSAQLQSDSAAIEQADRARQEQIEAQKRAEAEARAAQEDASFWGEVATVAKVVAIAGSVAAAAATGGSSLVVAAALLSAGLTGGAVVGRKLGVDDDVCLGMELTGAAVGLTAGGYSAVSAMGEATSGAAAASSAASHATTMSATSTTVAKVGVGAQAVAGLARSSGAGADMATGHYQSSELDARADAMASGHQAEDAKQRGNDAVGAVRKQLAADARATLTAAQIEQDTEATRAQVLANMRA